MMLNYCNGIAKVDIGDTLNSVFGQYLLIYRRNRNEM